MTTEARHVHERAAGELASLVERTFTLLDPLADACTEIVSQASADAPAPSARQLSGVDVLADRVMEQQSGLIGAGLVVAPGMLADEQRYLQWRQRRKDGSFAPLFLDVDTAGDDPYDYPEMEWFRVPAQQGRRMIGGPYFDYMGAETCTLTYAVPVVVGGAFVGIAGADLLLSWLERASLSVMRTIDAPAALVNHERRVVTDNTPVLATGERIDVARMEHAHRYPVIEDLGWQLVVLQA